MSMSAQQLANKIKEVEGIDVQVTCKGDASRTFFDDYPYSKPMNGNCTVKDLVRKRIRPILATERKI